MEDLLGQKKWREVVDGGNQRRSRVLVVVVLAVVLGEVLVWVRIGEGLKTSRVLGVVVLTMVLG